MSFTTAQKALIRMGVLNSDGSLNPNSGQTIANDIPAFTNEDAMAVYKAGDALVGRLRELGCEIEYHEGVEYSWQDPEQTRSAYFFSLNPIEMLATRGFPPVIRELIKLHVGLMPIYLDLNRKF